MIKQDTVQCSNEMETAEMGLETVKRELANVYWQSVPQPGCTWKKGPTVCAGIAQNLHISCLESSGADGNWFEVQRI